MKPGDEAFFYHSGMDKAVVGVMRVSGTAVPDPKDGAWAAVPVAPLRPLPAPVTLKAIKAEPALAAMELLRQSRLSVSPVREAEWAAILALADQAAAAAQAEKN
jgi:predicted RNA-binding protein with PUA-like domain